MMALTHVQIACFSLFGLGLIALDAPARAAADVPFAPGFYVPLSLKRSCGEPKFQTYDWVLRFGSRNGRLTMSDSEGICDLTISDQTTNGRYRGSLTCRSQGETSREAITFETGAHKQIVAINGQPYAFCGAPRSVAP